MVHNNGHTHAQCSGNKDQAKYMTRKVSGCTAIARAIAARFLSSLLPEYWLPSPLHTNTSTIFNNSISSVFKKQGYEGHTTNIKGTMPLKDNHSLDSVKFPRHFPKTHCLQHSYMFSNYPSQVCIIINATGTTTNVSIKMFTLLYKQLILKTGNIRCTRKSIYYLL